MIRIWDLGIRIWDLGIRIWDLRDFISLKILFLEFDPERTVVADNQIQLLIKVGFLPILESFRKMLKTIDYSKKQW